MLMSELNNKPSFDKFMLEFKKFGDQFPNYSVGEILYSLNREIKKVNSDVIHISNEKMVELLDKARINEKG